jgi:Flp pilus assembly protein TadD
VAIAHLVLAAEITRRGAAEPVEPLLARAVELAPASADIWAGRGAVLLELRDAAGAVDAFRQALVLDPSHRTAGEGLARAEALATRRSP